MSWAGSITDEDMRSQVMVEVGTRWMVRDRETATAYFETQPMAPEVKTQVENRLAEFDARRANQGGGRGGQFGGGRPTGGGGRPGG